MNYGIDIFAPSETSLRDLGKLWEKLNLIWVGNEDVAWSEAYISLAIMISLVRKLILFAIAIYDRLTEVEVGLDSNQSTTLFNVYVTVMTNRTRKKISMICCIDPQI